MLFPPSRSSTITMLTAISFAVALAACGGGGGGGGGSTEDKSISGTLSGVAAVGAPIVNGVINISCAGGSALTPTTTSSLGAWQIALYGQALPCAAQVTGGTINGVANVTPYHSIATTQGNVNITPFTDLLVANLAGTATPSAWFSGLKTVPTPISLITQSQMTAALGKLRVAMPGLVSLSTINPITTPFSPTPGNISDDTLTALAMAIANTGVTYVSLLNNAAATSFSTPGSGFDTALTTAYTNTTSGGFSCGDTTAGIRLSPTTATAGARIAVCGLSSWSSSFKMKFGSVDVPLSDVQMVSHSFSGTSSNSYFYVSVLVPTSLTAGAYVVTVDTSVAGQPNPGQPSFTVGPFTVN